MRKQIVFMLCMVLAQKIIAQDSLKTTTLNEVVVSATKFELPAEKSGKVVFKLSKQELEQNEGRSLSDVLNRVPGVQMDGNFSAPGANPSYYVRGGKNRHSVILMDGVPMIDPAGIEQFYDLRFLSLNQFENIEVLQGSLSTLYGSGAAAGVVNLQTKTSTEDGIHGSLSVGAGSWKTFNQTVNVNGKFNKTSFSLIGSNLSSEGFSAAQDNDPAVTFDKDGLDKRNLYFNVAHNFTESFSASVFASYDWFENEFDTWTFTDGNESQEYDQFRLGVKGTFRYSKGSIDLIAQQIQIDREERTSFPTTYEGVSWYGEVKHQHQLSSIATLLSGVTIQKLSYGEKNVNELDTTSFTMVDPYTSVLIDLSNGFNLHAGLRLNTHSVYGNQLLYNVNPSWLIRVGDGFRIKLLASVSTAYITPSLFQLNTVWGGNPNLKPEEDFNVEYGATFYIKDKIELTAVNYYRTEENSITYSPTFQYVNTGQKRYVDGVTVNARYKVLKNVSVQADYAYTHTNLAQTFYRIPQHKAGVALGWQPFESSSISIQYQFTGERTDTFYPDEVKLDGFSLVDVTLSQKVLKNKLFAICTVANVLDEDFVAVYGYTTRGRNFSVGLRYSL